MIVAEHGSTVRDDADQHGFGTPVASPLFAVYLATRSRRPPRRTGPRLDLEGDAHAQVLPHGAVQEIPRRSRPPCRLHHFRRRDPKWATAGA